MNITTFTLIRPLYCIDTYQPREGPKIAQHMRFGLVVFGIVPYLPREGPETQRNNLPSEDLAVCIDTYLPREGPETSECEYTYEN